jgi:hypothetical protein
LQKNKDSKVKDGQIEKGRCLISKTVGVFFVSDLKKDKAKRKFQILSLCHETDEQDKR